MPSKKTSVPAEVRERAREIPSKLAHKPGVNELLTEQNLRTERRFTSSCRLV